MNIYDRFKRLKLWNKLGAIGAIASILGLVIVFWPGNKKSQNIVICGDVENSQVIQIQDSNGADFQNIISDIVSNNEKLTSIVKKLESAEAFILKREIERVSSYFPSGYRKETHTVGPTTLSKKLKEIFLFINKNFSKQITGRQFKEIESSLSEIISGEPFLSYAWFYRGLIFSFAQYSNSQGDKFKNIANTNFQQAENIFNIVLEKDPENPYLLLYKGMNLTHLNKGAESVYYLNEALRVEPEIFKKHRLLGIICYWKHIEPKYAKVWELAFKKY
jgi:tetratricopeptide (TPR) repeat protein